MLDYLIGEIDPKIHNHWKMFIQVLIMASSPFIHNNIITFFSSYFPKFEDFRINKTNKIWITCTNFLIDLILTTPVLFLLFTFYARGIYLLLPIAIFLAYVLPFFNRPSNISKFGSNPRRAIVTMAPGKFKFTFLDHQISMIFLLICFAIMYCDTSMFDENLSKTTRDGIGTMDLGSGLILFTSGITSRQARDKKSSLKKRFSQSIVMIGICLTIGTIRAIMAVVCNKGDTSHGSHWSIFLIIASIMLISLFIPNVLVPFASLIAFLLSLTYQTLLNFGLEDYLIPWDQHSDFLGKNAIGMCQTVGFLACYLAGLGLGRKLYDIANQGKNDEDKAILFELLMAFGVCIALFLYSYFVFGKTGPTACNLTYVAYILAMGHFTILAVFVPDRMIEKLSSNMIFDGPAKTSRLIYFTAANLLTGLVNIIFDLEKHSAIVQYSIAIAYLFVLHAVFAALVKFNINIRFW
eukprot:TRINITY_DN226_c0_g1_i2.p1 TRINITY_DN226_c0_g1~~TRINITY_DN226_c0_g1_i2.p1  ORF type:complete len:465 (-),score=84.08 TRINITY_DN226_c0_g1_i2:115-1509(-)